MALKLQRCLAYPYNKKFPSDDINDVKVLHCVTEEGKQFQTEHVHARYKGIIVCIGVSKLLNIQLVSR